MKKIILTMLVLVSVSVNAQKDVTKFLGIPVDGSKTEMKKKLIEKGFTYNAQFDNFEGEFNGKNVNVSIVTNNNKVWRIAIYDVNSCGEGDIKIRFNNLCNQFARNKNYISASLSGKEYEISESEDISYEILVNNKRYEASYYQIPNTEDIDTIAIQKTIKEKLLQKYTQAQIDNPTEKQAEDMLRLLEEEKYKIMFDMLSKKSVWFMIREFYGKYLIVMYYDNEYNHADGEDL